jgi:hypothetical protein
MAIPTKEKYKFKPYDGLVFVSLGVAAVILAQMPAVSHSFCNFYTFIEFSVFHSIGHLWARLALLKRF